MIRKFLFFIIAALFVVSVSAQITISKNDYYDVGVNIYRINHKMDIPINEVIGTPLQFSAYSPDDPIDTLVFSNPMSFNNGIFSDATVAYKMNLNGFNTIFFEKTTAVDSKILGIQTDDIQMIGRQNIKLDKDLLLTTFPISTSTTISDVATGSYKIKLSDFVNYIPEEYLGNQLIQGILFLYDTIGIFVDISISSDYSDFGSVNFSGESIINGDFDYLREFRTIELKLDAKLRSKMNGKYTSIGPIIGPILQQMGYDEISLPIVEKLNFYNYWTNGFNYPIAEIMLSEDLQYATNVSLRYKEKQDSSAVNDILLETIVFPNPAKNELQIIDEKLKIGDKIDIYDISGRLIKNSFMINNGSVKIDVSDLQQGMYFIKIKNKIVKFIKEN